MQETNWLSHLVHGVYSESGPSIVPAPDEFLPEVDENVIISLREDGVVVWKRAAEVNE